MTGLPTFRQCALDRQARSGVQHLKRARTATRYSKGA
jgi:hypothetical protein